MYIGLLRTKHSKYSLFDALYPSIGVEITLLSNTISRLISQMTPNSSWHYSDVIMGEMVPQITGVSIACSTVCSENIQAPRHWPLLGNPPVTAGFPSQRASNAENVSFDDIIMGILLMIVTPYLALTRELWSIHCESSPGLMTMAYWRHYEETLCTSVAFCEGNLCLILLREDQGSVSLTVFPSQSKFDGNLVSLSPRF